MQYSKFSLVLHMPTGEGNGNPLQYSCLGNPMDREVWWATVHGVTELDMTNTFPHANKVFINRLLI